MDKCLGRVDVERCFKYCLRRQDIDSGYRYCLGRNGVKTCHKYFWSQERRERLVSLIIGESLRVTRCRMVSRGSDQAEGKRKRVAKKVNTKRKTPADKRTNPVLRDGHPQDVAHATTVEEAESDRDGAIQCYLSWRSDPS